MQTHTEWSSVLLYFRQVLGIDSVLLPAVENSPGISSVAPPKAVLFILPRMLSAEAQSLFEKMILAMKLKASEFVVQARSDLGPDHIFDSSEFLQVVEFVDALDVHDVRAPASQMSQVQALRTWSPEVLLAQPELKKKVWEDLQQVMKKLS